MKEEREAKLPKWAQEELGELRSQIHDLNSELERTKEAHAVLYERNWFTLPGPKDADDVYRLWYFARNDPRPLCALHKDDILLIGRAEPKVIPRRCDD